jgi:GntR family transcriptional regulator
MNESPELVLDGTAPVWRQIEEQVRRFVLGGDLRPGEELPTVRSVAVALAVSPRAVERAYDRLERAGLVSRGDAAGPVVAAPPGRPADVELRRLCEAFLREAAARGHPPAAVLRACQACLEKEVRHDQAY